MQTALDQAIKEFGGPGKLAAALGDVTPQAISQWKQVPAGRVLKVAKIIGVSRHELRPDLYPVEAPSEKAVA